MNLRLPFAILTRFDLSIDVASQAAVCRLIDAYRSQLAGCPNHFRTLPPAIGGLSSSWGLPAPPRVALRGIAEADNHLPAALDAGDQLTVPRVAKLPADPTFHPLEQWIRQRKVELDELKGGVDRLRQKAAAGLAACARPFHRSRTSRPKPSSAAGRAPRRGRY